jgi:hypothetical protein
VQSEQYDAPSTLAAGSNQFLPWATSSTANVMPLANYTNSGGQLNGVSAGIADPTIFNRAMRQATFIAAGLAQFTANAGYNVNDDGDLTNFIANLTQALHVSVNVPPFATNAVALAGTDTSSMINPATLSYVIGQKALLLSGGSIQGNLAVSGSVSVGSISSGPGSFASLTVSGAVTLPAGSVAAAAVGAGLTNAQQAQMPTMTAKANVAAGAAQPQDVPIATLIADAGYVVPTYAQFQCQTPGEVLTANGWTTRLLAAQVFNNIAGAVLGSDQVTLAQGTYLCWASASAYATAVANVVEMKLRLRNVGTGAAAIAGQNTFSGASTSVPDGIVANLNGVFQVPAGGATYALDSWQNANMTSGGIALGTGVTDVFANLLLEKVA